MESYVFASAFPARVVGGVDLNGSIIHIRITNSSLLRARLGAVRSQVCARDLAIDHEFYISTPAQPLTPPPQADSDALVYYPDHHGITVWPLSPVTPAGCNAIYVRTMFPRGKLVWHGTLIYS